MFKSLIYIIFVMVNKTHPYRFRIVGGLPVNIEQFPYQLQLNYNGNLICGAVLISNDTALTAAHCIQKSGLYSIRAGTSQNSQGGELVNVKQIIIHPSWFTLRTDYDLAILKLVRPLKLSKSIQPVKLPSENSNPTPGQKGYVTGFGRFFSYVTTLSDQLRAVEVPVLNVYSCTASYPMVRITPRMFCAGYNEGGKDACQGDSGGPFVINGVLNGIVSWGLSCAEIGFPGVYTNIAALREYIRMNTNI